MARLTSRPAAADADRVDGQAPPDLGTPPTLAAPAANAVAAVRARLAPAFAAGDEPGLTVVVLAQRQVLLDGRPVAAALRGLGGGRHVLERGAERTPVILEAPRRSTGGPVTREVLVDGFRLEVEVEPERRAALRERATRGRSATASGGSLEMRAVIPGKVAAVSVVAGDPVHAGQTLLVVEAMKMQNELRAPRDGTIERVGVAEGVKIEIGDLLVVISQEVR
jgi:biotin carboxyl carrier protein